MLKRILGLTFAVVAVFSLAVFFSACTSKKLNNPQNLKIEERVLSWDAVEGASGYSVNLNGRHFATTEECSLPAIVELTEGIYTFDVKAIGGKSGVEDSGYSSAVLKLEEPLESGYDENGYYYTLLEGGMGYEVTLGSQKLPEGVLTIPSFFNGYPVLAIGEFGFSKARIYGVNWSGLITASAWYKIADHNNEVTEIVFPKHLKTIGQYAFAFNTNVEEVVIPESVEILGEGTFYAMIRLKRVTLSKNIKEIPKICFAQTALEALVLHEGLERIGYIAFYNTFFSNSYNRDDCITEVPSALSEVVLPESLVVLGEMAFCGRENLEKVTLPPNLEDFPVNAFSGTKWADGRGLVIYNGVVEAYCDDSDPSNNGTVDLVIPEGVHSIESITSQDIRTLYIPDGVSLIGSGGHMFLLENAVSVRLPADLKELPDHLFSDCYKLKDVEIPKGVTVIGSSAFSDCNELDQIELPDGLIEVCNGAFKNTKIEELTFPDGFKYLRRRSLRLMGSLKRVVLPASTEVVEEQTFYQSEALEAIYYKGTPEQWEKLLEKSDGLKEIKDTVPVYFLSVTEPKPGGNYWCYGANGEIKIW